MKKKPAEVRKTRWKAKLLYPQNSELAKMPAVVRQLTEVLQAFANHAKRDATMHFVEGPALVPFPRRQGLHFVVGATHPGDIQQTDHSHVCGIRVHERGRYIRFWGPTRGIGTIVNDDSKEPVAQIVDSTVYLFVPQPSQTTFLFEGVEGTYLYSSVIDLAWKIMTGKKKPKEVVALRTLRCYKNFLEKEMGGLGKMLDAQASLIEIKIRNATNELRALHAEKETHLRLRWLDETKTEAEKKEYPRRDWSVIRKHPLVERVLSVDRALHVETRKIIAEHEGKYYNLGKFVIRMELGGTPSIWSQSPTHPARVEHPHISPQGVVCFGNIAAPLAQAAGEYRMGEQVELILSWLRDGYDPNLADTKIETWPRARGHTGRAT